MCTKTLALAEACTNCIIYYCFFFHAIMLSCFQTRCLIRHVIFTFGLAAQDKRCGPYSFCYILATTPSLNTICVAPFTVAPGTVLEANINEVNVHMYCEGPSGRAFDPMLCFESGITDAYQSPGQ